MAPPPSTPSPHRFLFGKRSQKPSTPIPSKLSQQVPQDAPHATTPRPTSGPTASQFSRVPRFAASTARRASYPPRSPSPAKPQFAISGVAVTEKGEEVHDATAPNEDDDEMLDSGNFELKPMTQTLSRDAVPEPEKAAVATRCLPSSPKRRRIDTGEATSTPQPTPNRFILPSADTSRTTFTQTDGTTPSRPAFLMASLPPPEPAEPLPDAFSPRRRGQKFVAGGLAAEVQSWVIEAAQSVSQSRGGKSFLKGEDAMHVMTVEKTQGDGPVFARGLVAGKGHGKAILIDGQANQKSEKVKAGDTVSMRLPTWEVLVNDEAWVVGVDWRTREN